jgi:DNA-binding response OmpR family regulator
MRTSTQIADDVATLPAAGGPAPAPLTRVLLIEDNAEEMLLVKYALQEFGLGQYELEWTRGLAEGVKLLRSGGLDVVLLDLGLPECQGPVSCAAVRDWASCVPIVVLTADDRKETEELVMTYGADDYLVKDKVSGLEIMHAMRAALYRKKARASNLALSPFLSSAKSPNHLPWNRTSDTRN